MRKFILACLTALAVAGSLPAKAASTPDVYSADKIEAGRIAFIQDQVKSYNGAQDPETVLLTLLSFEPNVVANVNALSNYAGTARDYSFMVDILTVVPDNGMAAWALAEKLSGQGYFTLAVPYFEIASKAYPDSYSTQSKAGLNAYLAGDYAACVTFYDRERRINHPYAFGAESYVKRGECHAFLGHSDQAASDFKAAASQDANTAWGYGARMFKDGVFGGCKGSAAGKTEAARKQFEKGKAYEAYRDVHAALQCDPAYIPALELRLTIEEADGNLRGQFNAHRRQLQNLRDGGQTDARDGAVLKPRNADQLLKDAGMLDMAGSRRNVAMVSYLATRALALEPGNWEAHLFRARSLLNFTDPRLYPLAWEEVSKADVASGPSDLDRATIHHVRGQLFVRAKLRVEALAEYNAAIALTPNDMRFYVVRGDLLVNLDKPDAALKDFNFVLQYQPNNTDALSGRARLYYVQKQWALARADLERIIAVEPGNTTVRADIIRMLDFEGRTAEADAKHKQLLVDDPAGAKGNAYLASRAGSGAVTAQADAARAQKNEDAARQAARQAYQSTVRSFNDAGDAWQAAKDFMQAAADRGEAITYENSTKELVRLLNVAIKKFDDTQAEIFRLKASEHYRYLTAEERANLEAALNKSSDFTRELLKTRRELVAE
ncbi:hypothetical protein ABAC460_08970 [Asticcacaulis sp. AC460]|uniref:tetratricopeptide repeat protein n=1 Tax=Asticcacaulis sp. AC460 TaxID=1282360 RepID=UPI0003C3AC3A|nr:tetratricopeptide repeat protein [Asticcacaulis sp. AC460]ESQ90609.1 hypothetical protein ABAC460_08970 [Asticcacaulis sp. AC460]